MGAFDDAIREHLELKRRQGVSEDDLEQQEQEALGKGAVRFARPEPTVEPTVEAPAEEQAVAEPEAAAEPEVAAEPDAAAEPEAAHEPPEPPVETQEHPAPPPPIDEEPEPDEVLPDEALEPSMEENVLEETPDFLEESPDQDRLWFEQRAPKDFDFDD